MFFKTNYQLPGVNLSFCYKANSTNMCDKNTIFEMLSRKKVLFIKRSYVTYVTHHCSNNAFINSQSNFSNFSLTWSKRGIKLNKAQYIIQLCKINPNSNNKTTSIAFIALLQKKSPKIYCLIQKKSVNGVFVFESIKYWWFHLKPRRVIF